MRQLLVALTMFILAGFAADGAADVPEFMSYQGVLTDSDGLPVSDGSYDVTFRLYDVETGGTALWSEVQSLDVSDGIFNAMIGKVTPLDGVPFDVPYWLGISVEAEAELAPRVELATAPYAGHAAFADHCEYPDDDWSFSGNDIYRSLGNVGIGVTVPGAKLDVQTGEQRAGYFRNAAPSSYFGLTGINTVGTAGGFYGGSSIGSYPSTPAAVFGYGSSGFRGGHFVAEGDQEGLLAQSMGVGPAIHGHAYGGGYSGYFLGGQGVYCDGQMSMGGFRMQTGAATGYVLTSDAAGVGTWQSVAGGGGDITAVYAGAGLTGGATSGDATVAVGAGTGIDVTADAVGLTSAYSTGSAYDSRFVNEGQTSSVSSSMITDGQVAFADMQNVFDLTSNTWYWNQSTGHFEINHNGTGFPVMAAYNNCNTGSDGDCLYLASQGSSAGTSTYVLYSSTYRGECGQFTKFTDDNQYAVKINAYNSVAEGLYVSGTIVSTSARARSVETSRGREPVFAVDSAEQEIVASGRAHLTAGSADVTFDRMFSESVSKDGDVRVTVTPIAGWSALYVERTGPEGFAVRSAAGETEIDFYWTAAGPSKDAIDRASIVLPDPEEDRRIEADKRSAVLKPRIQ